MRRWLQQFKFTMGYILKLKCKMPNTIHLDYHQEKLSQRYKDSQQPWPKDPSRLALSQIVNQTYKQEKL